MGNCYICKRYNEPVPTNEVNIKNINVSNNSFLLYDNKISDHCETIHNSAIVSKDCHIKLSIDRGRIAKFNKANNISNQTTAKKSIEEIEMNKLQAKTHSNLRGVVRQSIDGTQIKSQKTDEKLVTPKKDKIVAPLFFSSSNMVIESKVDILKNYKILNIIGRGAFGEVHKIKPLLTKQIYALKTINKLAYEENEDILSEINILKKLVFLK